MTLAELPPEIKQLSPTGQSELLATSCRSWRRTAPDVERPENRRPQSGTKLRTT